MLWSQLYHSGGGQVDSHLPPSTFTNNPPGVLYWGDSLTLPTHVVPEGCLHSQLHRWYPIPPWPKKRGTSLATEVRDSHDVQARSKRSSKTQWQGVCWNHWKRKVFSLLRLIEDRMDAWNFQVGKAGCEQSEKGKHDRFPSCFHMGSKNGTLLE